MTAQKNGHMVIVSCALELEFDRISLEMLLCGLYYFSVARQRGLADDPVKTDSPADSGC